MVTATDTAETPIIILPDIEDALYPLKPDELANLESSIKDGGVRDPLCVWDRDGEYVLVDGHHRLGIAQRLGIPYQTRIMNFESLEAVLDWIDKNQLGRRNLTDEERSMTTGRLYRRLRDARRKGVQETGMGRTTDVISEQMSVGSGTVKRSAAFSEAVEKIRESGQYGHAAAARILSGEIGDALTELPRLHKESPELLPLIAERIASGAKKIKEVTRGAGGLMPPTPSQNRRATDPFQGKPEDEAGRSSLPDLSLPSPAEAKRIAAEQGLPVIADDGRRYHGTTDDGETVDVKKIEANAHLIAGFSELRMLVEAHDPVSTATGLPLYVSKEISKNFTQVVAWVNRFAEEWIKHQAAAGADSHG